MRVVLFLIGIVMVGFRGEGQQAPIKNESLENIVYNKEELKEKYTAFKEVPDNYFEEIAFALSKCDDLQNCKIIFKEKKIGTTMSCRPSLLSIFKKRGSRVYIISINDRSKFDGVLVNSTPYKARIGVFAHELMHVRDYESRTTWGILKRGFQMLGLRSKRKFEHQIDMMTIEAGFGNYLYEWASYVLNSPDADDEYKAFKAAIYMVPDQIIAHVMKLAQVQLSPILGQ